MEHVPCNPGDVILKLLTFYDILKKLYGHEIFAVSRQNVIHEIHFLNFIILN